MSEERPRIRLSSVALPLLVVRGDELDPEVLESDARRFRRRFEAWGRFGISALAAADESEVDALCETRLERFEIVLVFERLKLESFGIEVVPTFRRPHVTLAHPDLGVLVNALQRCEHGERPNPYHVAEP